MSLSILTHVKKLNFNTVVMGSGWSVMSMVSGGRGEGEGLRSFAFMKAHPGCCVEN